MGNALKEKEFSKAVIGKIEAIGCENMTVQQLKEALSLKLLAGEEGLSQEVSGCYIGDLLSWVMGRASENDAWITIMNNMNIVAVAELSGAACVILCEGVTVADDIVKKADAEGVVIFGSEKTAYQIACAAGKVL